MLIDEPKKIVVRICSEYDDCVPAFYRTIPIEKNARTVFEQMALDMGVWHPAHPVMLDWPPGAGKTTFVYDVLLPKALEQGKNLLLVSNRVALSSQQKYTIMDRTNDPRRTCLTDEGVRQQEDFGSVRVITYHRLPALIHDKSAQAWISNLAFVVLDEAHFFTADAIFNERADYYLRLVCEHFCHAIRIYMTGTSWDILEPLAKAEMAYYRRRTPGYSHPLWRECYRYTLPRNFDQYRLFFFKKFSDLKVPIAQAPEEKWIIFTDSKERGKRFCETLGASAIYLDASYKGTAAWKDVVTTMRFDKQVLITTAALDNGININDDAVKHVAIATDNRVSLIQMMGRKRLKPKEHVTLWVCDLPDSIIAKRYQNCVDWLEWYERVESSPRSYYRKLERILWNNDDSTLRKLFRLGDSGLLPNQLAKHVIGRRQLLFGRILKGETTFRREVETWLGIDSQSESAETQLVRFYREHSDQPLDAELQNELRAILWRCYKEFGGKDWREDRKNTVGYRALNHYLTQMGLPYKISQSNEFWTLVKLEGEDRSEDSFG